MGKGRAGEERKRREGENGPQHPLTNSKSAYDVANNVFWFV